MELAVFSLMTLLTGGVFIALRALRLVAGRQWRWAGTAAGIACGGALVLFALSELRRAGLLMSLRVMGSETGRFAADPIGVAAFQDLRFGGPVVFAALGVLQGAALGLALSVITEADAAGVTAASRVEAWRSALGKAVVALPLPVVVAALLAFYQENRERFSSVEVGSFLRLALSPTPTGGSQQSTQEGPSGNGRLFPTGTFVNHARESLSGALRRRDLAFVAALRTLGTEARVPTEQDFEHTAFVETQHCDWLPNLLSYIEHFDDYNLLTLDIGEPLLNIQIAWELEARELKRWLDEIRLNGLEMARPRYSGPEDTSFMLIADAAFERLDLKARSALRKIGEQGAAARAAGPSCGRVPNSHPAPPPSGDARTDDALIGADSANAPASESDRGDPNAWSAEKTRRRILDLHAPYRVIGIANFYAAIGSFETAYLVLQRWLALDGLLREKELKLHDTLPRWFRVRVMSEAARMYKNTSPEARLSERYRRHLGEISEEYRKLLPNLPTARKVGNQRCFAPPASPFQPSDAVLAPTEGEVDAIAALTLARITSEVEFFEVVGLSGAISQRHVEDAKALTQLDFRCFEEAFAKETPPEDVRASLALYRDNAVVAWGRLAIRWVEAGKALRRVSDAERRATLGEVRVAVGGAVERLEHQARVEEARREAQRSSKLKGGVEGEPTLDYARVARRVLQEALALDQ